MRDCGEVLIMDTCWISTMLHIETMLNEYEQELMISQKNLLEKYLPHPDILVYLSAPQDFIKKNIAERGGEFDFDEPFLRRSVLIAKEHENYFTEHRCIEVYCGSLRYNANESVNLIIEKIDEYNMK